MKTEGESDRVTERERREGESEVRNTVAGNTLDTATHFYQSGRNYNFNRHSIRFIISHFFLVSVKTPLHSDLSLKHIFCSGKTMD